VSATVTVRGTASVLVEPDEATLALTLSDVRATADAAFRAVAERVETLERVCDELGVGRRERTTAGLSVQPEVEWVDGRNEPRGFRATSRTTVRVRDAGLLARVLEQAVARAGVQVDGPWWSVDLDNPARLEACRRAAATARSRAEAYADSLGARLGALASVAEPGTVFRHAVHGAQAGLDFASADAAAVQVSPGEQAVTAAVELTYELEQP
jgi:uncharacterized protein